MAVPRILAIDEFAKYSYDGAIAIDLYSFMYYDTNDAKPASSQADQLTEEANQRLFASKFCGIAMDAKTVSDAAHANFRIARECEGEFDCASSTFEVGDLLAVDEASSGTALENRKLVKVTDASLAIGICTERAASATTRVRARLVARAGNTIVPPSALTTLGLLGNGLVNTETLAGNKTIATGDPTFQFLDPTTARDVTLPAVADNVGKHFVIRNTADGAEVITVKNAGGATICTPTQNETAVVLCVGGVWIALSCAAHN
jgi:hypothetical protein